MVVRSEPKVSPSDIMQIVKSLAAREFFKYYPDIKKQYFWGGKLWTQSYFVETIGNANEETISIPTPDVQTIKQLKMRREFELFYPVAAGFQLFV